jgi:hypothetical protein
MEATELRVVALSLRSRLCSRNSRDRFHDEEKEIARVVYAGIGGLSTKEADELVELVFETLKETLGRGEKIKRSGF